MNTAFSKENASFSDRAHLAAARQVYPRWFRGKIAFIDHVGTGRDLNYAIDRELTVTTHRLRAPLHLSVQERFRRPRFAGFGDITITEWNLRTGAPSELYKLAAQLFVYGFYNEGADTITTAQAFSVPRILTAISNHEIRWDMNERAGGDQSFISLQVDDLIDIGAEMFTYTAASEAAA